MSRSLLINHNDMAAARAYLPEYRGDKEEDPNIFLEMTEKILAETTINVATWVRVTEPQLKGAAQTWFSSVKNLDLTWQEFREELLDEFDNSEIQARLTAKIRV